jgi:hypothetical protein
MPRKKVIKKGVAPYKRVNATRKMFRAKQEALAEKFALRNDPYALAHRYWDYLEQHPRRKLERINPYYENLLANRPNPDPDAKDDLSRAVRYAKEHYECYYEVGDVSRIIQWLPAEEPNPGSPDSSISPSRSNHVADSVTPCISKGRSIGQKRYRAGPESSDSPSGTSSESDRFLQRNPKRQRLAAWKRDRARNSSIDKNV